MQREIVQRKVALRKESVDRNGLCEGVFLLRKMSLSVRRAWIEIYHCNRKSDHLLVALRKESVDRNVNLRVLDGSKSVALRKESVDRNLERATSRANLKTSLSVRRAWIEISIQNTHNFGETGRSP